jgi:hypothetical protein
MADKTIQQFTPEITTVLGTDTILLQHTGGGDFGFATVDNVVLDKLAEADPVVLGSTLNVTGASTFSSNIVPDGGSASAGSIWKSGANIVINLESGGDLNINNHSNTVSLINLDNDTGYLTIEGRTLLENSESSSNLYWGRNTNGSFVGNMQRMRTNRAASTSFNFALFEANAGGDPVWRADGAGATYSDNAYSAAGADITEAMEWSDGNPDNEDRCGWTVVPDYDAINAAIENGAYGKKYIRQAQPGEQPIGIVSGNAGVRMGNDMIYSRKYLRDSLDRPLFEEYTVTEWVETVPAETEEVQREKEVTVFDDQPVPAVMGYSWIYEFEGLQRIARYSDKQIEDNGIVFPDNAERIEITPAKTAQVVKTERKLVPIPESIDPVTGVLTPAHEDYRTVAIKKTIRVWNKDGSPVMERITLKEAEEIQHSYHSDRIPQGITVPDDAKIITEDEDGNKLTRRVLNPDYDPTREHEPREKRKEWCDVNRAGFSPVLDDQVIGEGWVSFGKCGDGVTLYYR